VHGCLQLRMARGGNSADSGKSLDASEAPSADSAQHMSIDNVSSESSYEKKCHLNIEGNTSKLGELGLPTGITSTVGQRSGPVSGRTAADKSGAQDSQWRPIPKRRRRTSNSSPYVFWVSCAFRTTRGRGFLLLSCY
jgi:hypothetical protein